jgi:hypothetical protein
MHLSGSESKAGQAIYNWGIGCGVYKAIISVEKSDVYSKMV